MNLNTNTKRIISIIISVVMILTAFPFVAFAAGETPAVNSDGNWTNGTAITLNRNSSGTPTSFSGNAVNTIWMGVADTDFWFMQTEDNQVFTYSTALYGQKKSQSDSVNMISVSTYENDADYALCNPSGTWTNSSYQPFNYTMRGSWGYGTFTTFPYTETFTANGRAVYHPEWVVTHQANSTTHTTDGATSQTGNPVFTLTVVDMRDLLDAIDLAESKGKDTSAVLSGFDTTGATYYTQEQVDAKESEVLYLVCADYTALDAAIANAQALGANTAVPGGTIYDETTYNAMAAVLSEALAIDRHLDDTPENNAMLASKAAELQAAVDAVVTNNLAVITYYVDGVLYATSACVPNEGYNFHDVTDHYIATPTKANATFDCWRDADGNKIAPGTPVNSSFSVYAHFTVDTRGAGPVEQSGRYNHPADTNYNDGRGKNGVTLWVENNNFNFVQTKDGQEFSFNAAVSAVKNDPAKFARVTSVVFADSNTPFIKENNLTNDDIVYYCETGNAGQKPADSSDGNLPGVTGATFEEQMANSVVRWRYIYTFPANGTKTYNFDWTIKFKSGNSSSSTSTYTETVSFSINVTDLREIIQVYGKARSVANNSNSPLSPERQAQLVSRINYIDQYFAFDGSKYYDQTVIDNLVTELNSYIQGTDFPCDYSDLDIAIALAETYITAGNDNGHYMADEWNDLIAAYNAANTVDRNLYIDDDNINQPMIDKLTEDLEYAIEALSYKTHQNNPCDYTALNEAIAAAQSIDNNGLFDSDKYDDLQDALADGQNVDTDLYNVGTNQQTIDNATQAILAAIAALLQNAIDNADDIDTTGMTPVSAQNLEDAIDNAQAVADDNTSTADEMASAIEDIISAYDGLTPDKTELEQKIEEGNNTDTTGYTSDSIQALEDAITAGEQVFNDPDATVQDIQDAIDAIDNALDGLTADKTELEIAIYSAGIIDTTDVPQSLVDALDTAVANGQLVDADSDASVTSVENATEQIKEAIANILQQVIDDASNADTTGMTTNSIQDLEDAIDNAQATHDDTDSNSYTLAEAIAEVQNALDSLEPDKTELEETINAGESIDTTDIPQNLVDALEDALTNGETVDNDDDATLQEVTGATQDIIDAIDNILAYVIDEAENIDTTGMTPISGTNLEDALEAAEEVANNTDATPQEKVDAINDLISAINSLNPDKTELIEAINAGEGVDTTDIPQNLVEALENALDNGNDVDDDDDATVQEVKDATDDIIDAIKDILEYVKDEADNTDTTGMTDESKQALEDAIDNAETVLNNTDSTAEEIADAIDQLQDALDGLTPDKTELKEAIDAGEGIDTTDIPQNLIDALEDALDNGNDVDNDDDATVPEIKDATDEIIDAIKDILEYVKDDAEDTNTSDLTDDSLQDLEDAIENAENILNDPNADPDDIADAIEQLQDVIGNLEMNKIVPDAAGDINVDRFDTNYYYLVGLEADDTTLANVKALLENDGRQIIAFRGETQLGDSDHIGTGCVIKCVSIKDPTIVYEQATVILYGDVNGDGLINDTDFGAMRGEALFGTAIEGNLFRIAGDLNDDGIIDGFDMSKLELQISGARAFDQTVEYYK